MRKVVISGKVIVKQGNEIIIERGNDILTGGYKWLCSMWMCSSVASVNIGAKLYSIRFGKGSTANAYSTTTLDSIINVTPVYVTGEGIVGNGSHYESCFITGWASGALNAQLAEGEKLEELGLFFGMCDTQVTRWTSATWAQALFSRVVLGTDAFTPNILQPISVEWIIGVDFV